LIATAPPLAVPSGSQVLAVSAQAAERLAELGLHALVIDDVVDRRAVFADHDDYLRWQLDWLRRLDASLDADGAVLASAQKIKGVIDSIVMAARLIGAVLDELGPASIVLIADEVAPPADPLHNGHLQFWPRLGDPPLWNLLTPLAAAARGVSISRRDPSHLGAQAPTPASGGGSSRDRIVGAVAAATGVARHFDLLHWRPRLSAATTVVTWPGGYGGRVIVGQARRRGERVVLLDHDGLTAQIVEPVPWGRRALSPKIPTDPGPPRDVPGSGRVLVLETAAAEIDDQARLAGAGEVVALRVAAFTERIVPAVMAAAARLTPELDRLGVTGVVTANPSTIAEFATLIAARRAGIERTLAQHGDHMFAYDAWLVTETPAIDVQLTSDPTLIEDLPAAAERLGASCPEMRLSAHRARPTVSTPRPADPVCYVPSVLMGDTSTLPTMYFEDAWYHRWHRRLLGWMADRPTTRFVWKALPAGDHVTDPIVDAVAAVPNVEYVTRPFPWMLGKVSRVVTDFPSTPAYEAAAAGCPLLVLWFPRFADLRPAARAAFGSTVHECADEAAAIDALATWLDEPLG